MQADIDQGICEHRGCDQPYAYTVTYGGAPTAYACEQHAHRRRDSTPDIQPVENPHYSHA